MEDYEQDEDTDANPAQADANSPRPALVKKLKELSHKFNSYVFMEMAGAASSDPFTKIRGMIEEMIAKLLKDAQEEATQKAFCDEEMGKSKKSHETKSTTKDKLSARADKAAAKKAELEETVKVLEKEIAGIDAANAEATKIRTEESATYKKAHKDFSDAAEAVEKAIKVLKDFYEGASLLQVSSKTRTMSAAKIEASTEEDLDEDSDAPELGGSKSDAGAMIIGILEMSLEDFTKLLSETGLEEETAQEAYDKLTGENKISKATKMAEIKGALSQIKMLTTSLTETSEDLDMVNKELSAVEAYLEELKPQCEEKTMSYAEKKARREAEIDGLKEALSILSGEGIALLQTKVTVSRH